jgi:hypothetical protein
MTIMKINSRNSKHGRAKKTKAFSEDNEDKILLMSAKEASSKAIRSSKALGLTIKIIKEFKIISVNADKSETVEREIAKSPVDLSKLKKGIILVRN